MDSWYRRQGRIRQCGPPNWYVLNDAEEGRWRGRLALQGVRNEEPPHRGWLGTSYPVVGAPIEYALWLG